MLNWDILLRHARHPIMAMVLHQMVQDQKDMNGQKPVVERRGGSRPAELRRSRQVAHEYFVEKAP